jgi:uncharacterized protein YqhQ
VRGMIMTLALIIIFGLIILFEAISAAGKKLWRELTSVIAITVLGISFAILKMLDIQTPIVVLKSLLYPLGRAVFRNH